MSINTFLYIFYQLIPSETQLDINIYGFNFQQEFKLNLYRVNED